MKLAIVASHPIQYQAPLFRELATRDVDLSVLFCSDFGTKPSFDPGFGQTFQYDVPLTEGYPHEFLPNVAPRPHVGTTGLINPALAARIAAGAYDAVVLHGYNPLTNLLALAVPRPRGTALLLRGDSNADRWRSRQKAAAKQVALRILFARFDHFLVSGASNRRYYARYGVHHTRMTFAPFSVDNAYFSERADAARAERSSLRASLFDVHDARPVVLFVGKLQPHKRPLDLLAAFRRLPEDARATLGIIGDGELRDAVGRAANDAALVPRVRVLGFRNQSELPAIFAASDALVLPSEQEAWGLIVNEAMASGLAVATSDLVGCAQDLVVGTGRTFHVGDVAAIASIVTEWARDPAALAAAKRAARGRVAAYDVRETADAFIRGAERAVAARRRSDR